MIHSKNIPSHHGVLMEVPAVSKNEEKDMIASFLAL